MFVMYKDDATLNFRKELGVIVGSGIPSKVDFVEVVAVGIVHVVPVGPPTRILFQFFLVPGFCERICQSRRESYGDPYCTRLRRRV